MMTNKQTNLLLSVQRALLDVVTPSLRMVTAQIKNNNFHVIFYYDGPISELDYDLADSAAAEIIADFVITDKNKWNYDQEIFRLDYPAKMPALEVIAYKRYEKNNAM